MAKYDSPGYRENLPAGLYSGSGQGMTAPGSPPPYPVADIPGTTVASALVTPPGAGYQNADRVGVGANDSQVPSQTDLYQGGDVNPIGGVTGDQVGYSGAGQGHAGHFSHPNAMSREA